MSILNVNQVQPIGSGKTFTVNAENVTFNGVINGNINSTGIVTARTITGVTTAGISTVFATSIVGVTTAGITTAYVTSINEGQLQGYRNIFYNGAMVVNQRGYTSAASTSTGYSVDRWVWEGSSDAVVAIGQSTSVAAQPTGQGLTNSLHVRVTTADSSLSASQYGSIQQKLEGYDLQRIKKGSANAEPITLSFWVRSSKIGTYICELFDNDNTRQVSKSYTIDTANTWEKKILTFPADTTGAFDNDNNLSLYVFWWLAAGSTWTSGTLNTSWAANTNANRAVGQVNFLDTAGAQFNLTGCQLEVGPNATDFEFRSYGDELRMCQRYYYLIRGSDTSSSGTGTYGVGFTQTSTTGRAIIQLPVTMRTFPTALEQSGTASHYRIIAGSSGAINCSAVPTFSTSSTNAIDINWTIASGGTANQGVYFTSNNSNSYIGVSAEL